MKIEIQMNLLSLSMKKMLSLDLAVQVMRHYPGHQRSPVETWNAGVDITGDQHCLEHNINFVHVFHHRYHVHDRALFLSPYTATESTGSITVFLDQTKMNVHSVAI